MHRVVSSTSGCESSYPAARCIENYASIYSLHVRPCHLTWWPSRSTIAALNDLAFEDRARVQGAFPEHSHQYLIWSACGGVAFRDTSFTTVSLGFINEIVSKSIDEGSGYGMPSLIGGSAVQSTSPTTERGFSEEPCISDLKEYNWVIGTTQYHVSEIHIICIPTMFCATSDKLVISSGDTFISDRCRLAATARTELKRYAGKCEIPLFGLRDSSKKGCPLALPQS